MVQVSDEITNFQFLPPPSEDVGNAVIVLDRVCDVPEPDYCIHGRATCVNCPEWVWLGHASYDIVSSGQAYALCQPCATRLIQPDSGALRTHIRDHKRADGPHE